MISDDEQHVKMVAYEKQFYGWNTGKAGTAGLHNMASLLMMPVHENREGTHSLSVEYIYVNG